MAKNNFNLLDEIPKTWIMANGSNSVLIVGYRIARSSIAHFSTNPRVFEINGIKAVLFDGSCSYWHSVNAKMDFVDEKFFIEGDIKEFTTREGGLLILMASYTIGGMQLPEGEVLDKISSVAGLLTAIIGENVAALKLFQNVYVLDNNSVNVYGPAVINPLCEPIPDLSEIRFKLLQDIKEKISKFDAKDSQKIWLSLHWYDLSRNGEREDVFIKLWVAIEVLMLDNSTDIKPIKSALKEIYSLENAGDPFFIGQIFGLRSDILHNGVKAIIHAQLSKYLAYLYLDLLFYKLDIESEKFLNEFKKKYDVNLIKLLADARLGFQSSVEEK